MVFKIDNLNTFSLWDFHNIDFMPQQKYKKVCLENKNVVTSFRTAFLSTLESVKGLADMNLLY